MLWRSYDSIEIILDSVKTSCHKTTSRLVFARVIFADGSFLSSPVALVVLIGIIIVVLIGVATLVGFIAHRRSERRAANSSVSLSHPSGWPSEFGYAGARKSLGFWYADNPAFDGSVPDDLHRREMATAFFPIGRDREYFRQRRHSYSAPSSADDRYLEAISSFPTPGQSFDSPAATRYPIYACPTIAPNRLPRYSLTELSAGGPPFVANGMYYGSVFP